MLDDDTMTRIAARMEQLEKDGTHKKAQVSDEVAERAAAILHGHGPAHRRERLRVV